MAFSSSDNCGNQDHEMRGAVDMAGVGSERTNFGGARMKILLTLVAALGALVLAGNAFAGGPTITSDKADYAPGSTVTLTGAGWGVGETVHVTVDDTLGQTWSWSSSPDPIAGVDGSFTVTLTLPSFFVSDYSVHAVGSSGATADSSFTDSSVNIKDSSNNNHNSSNPLVIGTTSPGGSLTSSANVVVSFSTGVTGSWTVTDAGTQPSAATVTFGQTTGTASATVSFTLGTSVLTPAGTYSPHIHVHATDNKGNTYDDDLYYRYTVQSQQATSLAVSAASGTYGGAASLSGTLTKTSDSSAVAGKTISFSINGISVGTATTSSTGVATIPAASLSGINAGTYTNGVSASFGGDSSFLASSGTGSLTVNQASQTIMFGALSDKTFGDAAFTVPATGGASGNPVMFSATGNCTSGGTNGATIMITGAGSCTVTADQAGNTNYAAATSVPQTFQISKADQDTLSVASPDAGVYGQHLAMTSAGGSGTGAVTFTVDSGSTACQILASGTDAGKLAITSGTGTCSITAHRASDDNYKSADSASHAVTVSKADLAVTVDADPSTPNVDHFTKLLNAPNPAFSVRYSGFVNGDAPSSLGGTLTYGTTATTTSAVGSYVVTAGGLTSADYAITYPNGWLDILYASAGTCNGDAGHRILQPVNADGTSVFKQGSTVPAKFRVCDANGVSIGTAGVVSSFKLVQKISGTESQAVNETVDSTTPDTAFRWSSTDQQWIYNISTKSLSKSVTYAYVITLNDGSTIPFQFGLK